MAQQFDQMRPDVATAEFIEAALRLAGKIGFRRAARAMEAADVPVSVIARVLCDTDQRRPTDLVILH